MDELELYDNVEFLKEQIIERVEKVCSLYMSNSEYDTGFNDAIQLAIEIIEEAEIGN